MTEFGFESVEGDCEIGSWRTAYSSSGIVRTGKVGGTCIRHKSMIVNNIRKMPGLNLER